MIKKTPEFFPAFRTAVVQPVFDQLPLALLRRLSLCAAPHDPPPVVRLGEVPAEQGAGVRLGRALRVRAVEGLSPQVQGATLAALPPKEVRDLLLLVGGRGEFHFYCPPTLQHLSLSLLAVLLFHMMSQKMLFLQVNLVSLLEQVYLFFLLLLMFLVFFFLLLLRSLFCMFNLMLELLSHLQPIATLAASAAVVFADNVLSYFDLVRVNITSSVLQSFVAVGGGERGLLPARQTPHSLAPQGVLLRPLQVGSQDV